MIQLLGTSIPVLDFFILILIMAVTHEMGHGFVARRQGIFRGYSVDWMLNMRTHLRKPFNSKWDYLSGFMGSMVFLPVYMMVSGGTAAFYVFVALIGSIVDLLVLVFYDLVIMDLLQDHVLDFEDVDIYSPEEKV